MSTLSVLGGGKLAVLVAAAIIAAALVAVNTSVNGNGAVVPEIKPKVTVTLANRTLTVSVELPGPQLQYQYYQYYYYYYQAVPPVPVRTVIAVEKLLAHAGSYIPELYAAYMPKLVAYGEPHNVTVKFNLVEAGHYRVKVLFWNELLSILEGEGSVWKPLAKPYVWEGDVS